MIEFNLSAIAPALNAVLIGQDVQFKGCSTDTRKITEGSIFIALRGERFDGHDFVEEARQQGAIALLVENKTGCNLPTLQVTDTRKALGQLAKLWRQRFTLKIAGVTGSNGKTTVKEMLKAIFTQAVHTAEKEPQENSVLATQGNLNNDIGVPLTLFGLSSAHRYAVIEMGANHPNEIAYLSQMTQPTVAVITQCAPAHLEGFKSVEGVARAKGEIFSGLMPGGTAVINQDDDYAPLWQQLAQTQHCLTFGLDKKADFTAHNLQLASEGSQFLLYTPQGEVLIRLPLVGKHNVMNALAASACAVASGCSLEDIQQGLEQVTAVKGRLQRYQGLNHTLLLDDTYNANPTSLYAALSVLNLNPTPHWLVLGDMNELGTQSATLHQQAGRQARAMGIERLWAVGNMSRHAVDSFGEGAEHFLTHADLVAAIRSQLPPQATLLVKGSRGMQMEKIITALRMDA